MTVDLPLVWALLLAFGVFLYVVLDGFDLGIGILSPLLGGKDARGTALATIAPVWDGNETWLVFGGAVLFAAFPLAFSIALTALYAPLTVMVLALIFRGVAFEFRHRATRGAHLWDAGFAAGSLVATLCQGVVLGAFVQGIAVEGRAYAGGWYDWLTPFSLFTAAALAAGYALLGAGWLILRTEGALQARAYRLAAPLAVATLAAVAVISAWTPLLVPAYAERWFAWPNIALLAPVPVLVGIVALLLADALRRRRERRPFPLALALFALSYLGLGISLYPAIVPPSLHFRAAASPHATLVFMLVGTAVLLPIILGYTVHSYRVFRGKVRHDDGYG
ncbi:MAG: cytochrome d ubiquinol oxidase subunit II [Alphaproteobacteria bacterium]